MKFLEFIKNKNFQGTIYIIPFTIPKSTSLNSRNCKFKYQHIKLIKIKERYRKSYKVSSRIWKRVKYKSQGDGNVDGKATGFIRFVIKTHIAL